MTMYQLYEQYGGFVAFLTVFGIHVAGFAACILLGFAFSYLEHIWEHWYYDNNQ